VCGDNGTKVRMSKALSGDTLSDAAESRSELAARQSKPKGKKESEAIRLLDAAPFLV
jgi:hypothetical protein